MASEFGLLVTEYRHRAGLSQSELARRSGISASYINRLESGDRQPSSRDLVLRIAEALSLAPSDTDCLLRTMGYAPEMVLGLAEKFPVLGLMADILQDSTVADEDIELVVNLVELINRQRGNVKGRRMEDKTQVKEGEER